MQRQPLCTLATGLLLSTAAALGTHDAQAKSPNPYTLPNNSWISISGTAENTGPDAFRLDYGEGTVLVEMDDWDWYHEGYKILNGDDVTVYGYIDDDTFELTKIEASSVYVDGLNSFFYASGADEEGPNLFHSGPVVLSTTTVQGRVDEVNGREFTVSTGAAKIRVDTDEMTYNPTDDVGFQKIKKGDWVRVTGHIGSDLFEKSELKADTITTLYAEDRESS